MALYLPGERHTAFTGRMLNLLRTGSAAAGPFLSLGDIFRLLYAHHLAEGLPVPRQRGTETADLFGLVRNAINEARNANMASVSHDGAVHDVLIEAQQDQFDVVLMGTGDDKIKVIWAIRELTRLGLEEAEELNDTAPQVVLGKVGRVAAIAAKASLENAGAMATVVLRVQRSCHGA